MLQPLTVDGAAVKGQAAAVGPGEATAVFDALCAQFRIDLAVSKFLVETMGLESLEDFKTVITDAAQVESRIVDRIPNLDKPALQAARVRQAWTSVGEAASAAVESKKRGLEQVDFEQLLEAPVLAQLKAVFWARHKI